jgi:hypothetical protein
VSKPTLYQRYHDGGGRAVNRAGVAAVVVETATVTVKADALRDLVPAPGDFYRDASGGWWEVKTVGPLADGSYPLACERWKDGAA